MPDTVKKEPPKIPDWVVPARNIDYVAEAVQTLGGWRRFGKMILPPPFLAYFSLLEMAGSDFYRNPYNCQIQETANALYLLIEGERALQKCAEYQRNAEPLENEAAKWYVKYHEDIAEHYAEIVEHVLILPLEGFAMLPQERPDGRPKAMLYDACFLSSFASLAARELGCTLHQALWKTPLCLLGHTLAATAIRNGVKHVERHPDKLVLDKLHKEAAEREDRGELHPWQVKYPNRYPPTDRQIAARLEVLNEWQILKDAVKNGLNS